MRDPGRLQRAGVLIAGGSHAAVAAAIALRAADYSGPIRLISSEDQLPYHRPPLSKEAMAAKAPSAAVPLRPISFYAANRIDLTLGRTVRAVDRAAKAVCLSDGMRFAYDHLILATGARPRKLPASVIPSGATPTLRTYDDYRRFSERLATARSLIVIGGGLIGLEVAASAVRRGVATTVIEAADRLMARNALPTVSDLVLQHHEMEGLSFRLNSQVARITRVDERDVVTLASGETISADVTLVAIGSQPDDRLARTAGLPTGDGVLASASGRTDDPAIFALGDCAAWFDPILGRHMRREAIQPAQDQARIVAAVIAGLPSPPPAVPRAWSHQGSLRIQMAGDPHGITRDVLRHRLGGGFVALGLSGDRVVAAQAVNASCDFNLLTTLIGQPQAAAEAALCPLVHQASA